MQRIVEILAGTLHEEELAALVQVRMQRAAIDSRDPILKRLLEIRTIEFAACNDGHAPVLTALGNQVLTQALSTRGHQSLSATQAPTGSAA